MQNMKIAIVCGTKYQILNCLNYVLNQKEFENAEYHLFINDKHIGEFYEKLCQSRIFQRVYRYSIKDERRIKKRFLQIKKSAFPMTFLKQCLVEGDIKEKYKILLCANLSSIVCPFIFAFPQMRVFLIEDGTASYFSGAVTYMSQKNRKCHKFFRRDISRCLHPERLYINNKQFCKNTDCAEVIELPHLQDTVRAHKDIFEAIFGRDKNKYNELRLVYLSQPFSGYEGLESPVSLEIMEILKKYPFAYRPHPREKKVYEDAAYVDRPDKQNSWELICSESIGDDHILIGRCSTAQVVPKLIFNREPYLIFINRLFEKETQSHTYQVLDEMCEDIKNKYSNQEKVFIVDSLEQIEEILENIF